MTRLTRILVLGLAAWAALFWLTPEIFSCHGILRYRFMPAAEAQAEFARVQAELAKQRTLLPALNTPALERWIKYYGNPIFQPGARGSWEEFSVDCFTVAYHNGQYWLWYVGTPRSLKCQIGLATSLDGVHWTRHAENPVLRLGAAGAWDSQILICQHILFDRQEGIFKMWYVGGNRAGEFGIGYATSADGVHWVKYAGNPVMVVTEAWEGTLIEGQVVLKIDGTYRMWYGGINIHNDVSYIGAASSNDGVHWVKYSGNPIISPAAGDPLPWDGYSVDTPDVLYEGGIYHMYYRGWRKEAGTSFIGHATSTDGLVWTRDPENPVLVTSVIPGSWDVFQVYRARVFKAEGDEERPPTAVDRMWFTGRDHTLKSQVGLAISPREDILGPKPPRRRIPMAVDQDNMNLAAEPRPQGGVSIRYFTPWLSQVGLRIFDPAGRPVRTIVKGVRLAGFYEAAWDGKDDRGRPQAPGLYYAELSSPTYALTKEITLVK